MANKLSYADATQLYRGALMIRKGKLAKVREILSDDDGSLRVTVFDLTSQRAATIAFNPEEFKTPAKRMGYVNINQNAAYLTRVPHRVYVVGLHSTNVDVRIPEEATYNDGMYTLKDKLRRLEDGAITQAYNNEYPSFLEAVENAKEWKSSCAFDKQFAVSSEGWIYYKHRKVGEVLDMKPKFNADYQYLQTLLDGNHEKTSGTFGATAL